MTSTGHHRTHQAGVAGRRRWPARVAAGAGALVVLVGVAVLLAVSLGRPRISLSSSAQGTFHVALQGWGAGLSGVTVTSGGVPVAWARHGGQIVPASEVAQGQAIEVRATAAPPGWLRWLLGGRVSADVTVRTPSASLADAVAVASKPGYVPVTFSHTVTAVSYRLGRGPARVVHLGAPSNVADLPVPSHAVAGTLEVAGTPWTWERFASTRRKVTWFLAPLGAGTVALADPSPGATSAPSNGRITLTFAQPVTRVLGHARPSVTPAVPGRWSQPGPNTLVFTPTGFGWGPGTTVAVRFDRLVQVVGTDGRAKRGATTTSASSGYRFTVAPASTLRLEQILAQLHYLPLRFVPAPGVRVPTTFAGEVASMSRPLRGSFAWAWGSTPASLQAQWTVGSPNVLLKGALMTFYGTQANYDGYAVDPLTVAQLANAPTWDALLHAAAADRVDPHPYSYVYVTQSLPEKLTLWENGKVVLTAAVNTGIPASPTADGTFPVYLRYTFNYMSGHNPDGSYYHDPVYWINYFNGGDAVHGFVRASYGYPQSLGCVELPITTAHVAFDNLAIGDLVTVAN
ncbi:MAG: L,D-transpeptidase family protein [Acidimicrobiales bacterium]